jgi:hypothetical protein
VNETDDEARPAARAVPDRALLTDAQCSPVCRHAISFRIGMYALREDPRTRRMAIVALQEIPDRDADLSSPARRSTR